MISNISLSFCIYIFLLTQIHKHKFTYEGIYASTPINTHARTHKIARTANIYAHTYMNARSHPTHTYTYTQVNYSIKVVTSKVG